MSKTLVTSRTFWLHMLLGGLQIADQVAGTNLIPQPYGIAVQSVAGILLRLVTDAPISGVLSDPSASVAPPPPPSLRQ